MGADQSCCKGGEAYQGAQTAEVIEAKQIKPGWAKDGEASEVSDGPDGMNQIREALEISDGQLAGIEEDSVL